MQRSSLFIEWEIVLRDGARILIRPGFPNDQDRLREGFTHLSKESKHRRFMTELVELPDAMVRSLTEIDYRDHMAWVALDPSQPGKPGIGVARYVRLAEAQHCAEAAVTVVDSWQGRGVGTLLLGLLIMTAVENGIDTFRAYVLKENDPMLGILKDLGAAVAHEEGSLMRVEMPLPAQPEDLPDTPTGRVLKAAARRLIPPLTIR